MEFQVSQEQAFQHAAVAMVQHLLIPTPSLFEDEEATEEWESAKLGDATLVHDINGKPLFFFFPVVAESGDAMGSIWVAADKILGSTVISIQEGQNYPNFAERLEGAVEVALSKYPDFTIDSVLPVVYAYPRIGYMIKMQNPKSADTVDIILDYYDYAEAVREPDSESLSSEEEPATNCSWSFLDNIPPEEIDERIQQWESQHAWDSRVCEAIRQYGNFPDDLTRTPLKNTVDLIAVAKVIYAQIQCEIYSVRNPWTHFCQSGVPFCAAAIGRNIAAYWGVQHLEDEVAQIMGITRDQTTGRIKWPTVEGELTYYKSSQGLDKAGSVTHRNGTIQGNRYFSDWRDIMKAVRENNSSFVIPSSIGIGYGHGKKGPNNWKQPGHWNALYGIKICKSSQGNEKVSFIVFDPYPPNTCKASKVVAYAALKDKLRSHTIPLDKEESPPWPDYNTPFEPWKCKQHWYRVLYEHSCRKWERFMNRFPGKPKMEDFFPERDKNKIDF